MNPEKDLFGQFLPGSDIEMSITLNQSVKQVKKNSLEEIEIAEIPITKNVIKVKVNKGEILSLLLQKSY
jgi:CRISPR/Cas system type I-B associated protein Csh2 (Cas7 group RAMP superfamily)